MKTVRLTNLTRDQVLCPRCGVADKPWTRIRGLLGRAALPDDEGLLIAPCPSIHMWGMKFAIDVVFLTHENVVTDIVAEIAPGKYYLAKDHAGKPHAAIELPAGAAARGGVQIGDQIEIE